MKNDPNPRCCYKPDVIVVFEEKRVSVETKKKVKLAKCPNCGEVKEKMNEEHVAYGV